MRDSATILLVEDDQSLLDGISDLLEVADIGYQVKTLTASNGRAGLARVAEETPDLIISDIMMPLMDGFEFLAEVRQNPAWIHIPFIFLTARGEKRDIQEGRSSGAELYITKPFDNDELLQLVKGQLDRTFQLQFVRQQRLDNLKRTILQLLNHEFRTPLTYVTAYYEMLADGLSIEASNNLQEYLKGIQAGCVRLTKLVQDLIAVVELRTGETAAHYRQQARPLANPGELLREAGRQAAALAQAKGIRFIDSVPDELPAVYGSPDYLADIFARLIDNAIKFTYCKREPGGFVQISAERRQNEVYFTIGDNGIGFPEHVQGQLFDLFFQYNRDQLEQQGSGSGLAITKGLAELHQGRIDVESEKGIGSQFSLVLPVYNPANMVTAGGTPPQMRQQATILVVEDDRFLLDGLRELLEISGGIYHFRVLTAVNGRLGLEVLARHHPDLIISDIMMPEMDGFQFLTEVRRNPAWLHIPFIFLTARGEREAWLESLRIGVEDYITKPYDSDQLLEMIATQLNRHFQRQGVVYQSFEDLKRSILDLLQPDFRLPLDTVSRYSNQMAQNLESAQTPEDLKESLRGIEVGSSRLNRLVRDFITLAELKTGEAAESFALEARLVNPGSLLIEAAQLQQYQAGEGQVKLSLAIDHSLPEIRANDGDLLNGFGRLIALLIHLPDDSRPIQLQLTASKNGRYIDLEVGRQGAGFDRAVAAQVQALLGSNDQAILESADYGPSLVILKGVVDLHGGQISLQNDPAAGCTFTIRLPVYQPETSSMVAA
jgi:two-component system sensor histidine kinase/response regulator